MCEHMCVCVFETARVERVSVSRVRWESEDRVRVKVRVSGKRSLKTKTKGPTAADKCLSCLCLVFTPLSFFSHPNPPRSIATLSFFSFLHLVSF